ncbi:GTPase HflX [Halorubellus sp. JP-L1]|uniref:GTPase HflX n=1 Tax=Halorubellus sp. JP-L1 TaxID=2715753 RepID=UPI0014073654|nr:GTPase HflX [Halorubellus sp. JP-L1]NHN40363.1 GTPase HflX [Halorubellus sp. JP-L1]
MQESHSRLDGSEAIVVARSETDRPDPTEITRLAEAAGFAVADAVTQRRREDPGTWIGRGKAEALAERARDLGVDVVVFDGGLDPGQYADLVDLLPDGVEPVDRYRLVLDVFADGTGDERAALQVEAARLSYVLPRLRRITKVSQLSKAVEKGNPILDVEARIDRIENQLADIAERAAERRESRRASGLGLVAIAGYTNAGKTTLLHRLADDLSLADADAEHADLTDSTPIEDRLFVTLETITRQGTLDDLDVAYTDTVGFVDALPHDLVESFSATIDEAASADVTLLVVDATDDPERLREKVSTSVDAMGDTEGPVVGVLNKVDAVDGQTASAERRDTLAEFVDDVVAVSALEGTGVERLEERVREALPTETATLSLPNDGDGHRLLSWLHDHASVDAVEYGSTVTVRLSARPSVVERARARVADLG